MSHTGLGLREELLYNGIFGACDLGSSHHHLSSFIHYTFNQNPLSTIPPQTKTRRSYRSLAIDVARQESRDLAIVTAIEKCKK